MKTPESKFHKMTQKLDEVTSILRTLDIDNLHKIINLHSSFEEWLSRYQTNQENDNKRTEEHLRIQREKLDTISTDLNTIKSLESRLQHTEEELKSTKLELEKVQVAMDKFTKNQTMMFTTPEKSS